MSFSNSHGHATSARTPADIGAAESPKNASPRAAEINKKATKNAAFYRYALLPVAVIQWHMPSKWGHGHCSCTCSFFLPLISPIFVCFVLRVTSTSGASVPELQPTPSTDQQTVVSSSTHPWPKSVANFRSPISAKAAPSLLRQATGSAP